MTGEPPNAKQTLSWTELNRLGDETLLTRLLGGEQDALAVLFDRYHRLIFSIAMRLLRDGGEAEDMVQTIFLNLFLEAAKFDPRRGTLKVWLLQFAYHRSINRRRGLSAQGVYLWDELDSVHERGHAPELEAIVLCEQMLARLKPLQREVLELTYFEGCTAQEIAVRQKRPAAQIRHDLYRSLARLRKALSVFEATAEEDKQPAHPAESDVKLRKIAKYERIAKLEGIEKIQERKNQVGDPRTV